MKWTEEQIEYLKSNYPKIGPKQLSINLKRSVDSINLKLKSLNLRGKINKKYSNFEFRLDNPKHIYLMGILWADGYLHNTLNRLELSIVTEDFNDISNLFDVNYWAVYHRNRKKRKPQTTIGLYREEVCGIFRNEYNYTEKSNECPNFLDKIPVELLYYFIRGFFDGDGCFYISKDNKQKQCYLAGTYNQDWSWVETIFKELDIKYSIKQKIQKENQKYSVIYINKNSIETFGNYIYHNYDSIGIKRKYEKFLKIIYEK
jgi:hypothetical protein